MRVKPQAKLLIIKRNVTVALVPSAWSKLFFVFAVLCCFKDQNRHEKVGVWLKLLLYFASRSGQSCVILQL